MRTIPICLGCIMVMVFLFRPNSYSGLDGEKLFTAKCGKCHASGSAPVFSPVKYASSQWERFFEKDKHKRKKDISQEVTAEELEAIKQYLVDHAADSDRPVAAGLK